MSKKEQRQLNFGLLDAEVVTKIQLAMEEAMLTLRKEGLPKLTKKDLVAIGLDQFAEFLKTWVATGHSAKESAEIAKQDAMKERLKENFDTYLTNLLKAVYEIAFRYYDEVVEVMYA